MCEKNCFSFTVAVVIMAIVLIATSVHKLEAYEVGFDYNPNSVSINEDQLYTEGTFFTGPGHYFITFIKNLRTVQFGSQKSTTTKADKLIDSLVSRTKDALLVNIECSFQYQLSVDKNDLLVLYKDWGDEYEDAFIAAARNILRNAMAEFDALQVFYERSSIEARMRTTLTDKLLVEYRVRVQSFQLLDIDLPGNFSQALIDTENLNLNVQTVTYQKDQEIGKSAGRINKALQDANGKYLYCINSQLVIVNNAQAYASKVTAEGEAKSGAISAKFNEQSQVLRNLKNSLDFSQKQLAAYYFYEMLDFSKYGSSNINIDTPQYIQCISTGTCV
ncbi:UNKNOWN [Stylonychia lemnae]|uniref:Band 7 domain-containing protein n=1 Tax=Stylonychia lemnae TaxID=5949 RepID=A0A078A5N0_STYLE|nr:UNKNOWN [Stylonychia lemnae]|eukprot:CDW76860.1 UNKNOWN [Stylonychia lemnae]